MFKVEIKTSGVAFRSDYFTDKNGNYILDPQGTEVVRILKDIARKIEFHYSSGEIIDSNGNKVGEWEYGD